MRYFLVIPVILTLVSAGCDDGRNTEPPKIAQDLSSDPAISPAEKDIRPEHPASTDPIADRHTYNQDPDSPAQNLDGGKTPLDQGLSDADAAITRTVRQRIMDNKDLSLNAHNVKVITNDGAVVLRGPVESDDERRRIVEIARQVGGVQSVDNQLDVIIR